MLTPREKQILILYAHGLSAKLIAKTLCISPETVVSHKKSIMQKVGAKNIANTIHKAYQQKILA